MHKTITETLSSLEAAISAKEKALLSINEKAANEGRTKTEDEREEHDGLVADLEALHTEYKDWRIQKRFADRAKDVGGAQDTESASTARTVGTGVTVNHPPRLEPGIQFARLAMCLAKAKGDTGVAHGLMQRHYPNHPAITGLAVARSEGEDFGKFIGKLADMRTKAAIPAATTTDESWAGVLLAHNNYTADFISYLQPRTIIGQFGQNGVPQMNRIPFNVHIKGENEGGSADWVGQGKAKPVTRFGYFDAYHGFTKIAGISVLTDELIRFSDPSAETRVRDSLANRVIARLDNDLLDPAVTATPARPASLTNGVTGIASSGTDSDAIRADIAALFADADDTDLPQDTAVLIMRPATARRLGLLMTITGVREFPDLTVRGGSLAGYPVIVSNYAPANTVTLVFASEIYLSDDGTVTVDASREASIEMDDAPTHDSDTPTGVSLVSMFQTNSVALRAERYVHWSKRRANAVQVLTGVNWGA
jgi:HK97 family phage major capsid protein